MRKMKRFKLYVLIITMAFGASSCLDKYPEDSILANQAITTVDEADQAVIGIYSSFLSSALYSGYLTLLPDLQADLAYAINGYTNTHGDIWRWNILATNGEIEAVYASLYDVIGRCNFLLDNAENLKKTLSDDDLLDRLEQYCGEAYFARALAYSELIKLFCKAYNPATAKDDMGVVLRKYYSQAEVAKRASLYDSYQFVLENLAKAEELLDNEYDGYSSIYTTKAMVEALHARVALYMQDWENAIEYSTRLIESDKFALSSVNSLATSTESHFKYMWTNDQAWEAIWQIDLTPESYGGMLGSLFLGRNTDRVNYYPDYVPALWVLNLYEQSDLRDEIYFRNIQTGHPHRLYWPLLVKYEGNQTFINNYLLYEVSMPKPFRLAEQFLIRAEAYCREGEYSKASNDLKKLRASRFVSGTGAISINADNWLGHIANERVRELYMEGHRLQDLKRWGNDYNDGKGFERTPQTNSLEEGSSIKKSADDYMFVWPIPRHEVEAPGSQVAQNEGY